MRPLHPLAALCLICLSIPIAQAEIKKGKAAPVLQDTPIVLHDIENPISSDFVRDEETPCAFILFEDSTASPEQSIAVCKAAIKTLKIEQGLQFDLDHAPHPETDIETETAIKRSAGGTACSVVGEVGKSCAP